MEDFEIVQNAEMQKSSIVRFKETVSWMTFRVPISKFPMRGENRFGKFSSIPSLSLISHFHSLLPVYLSIYLSFYLSISLSLFHYSDDPSVNIQSKLRRAYRIKHLLFLLSPASLASHSEAVATSNKSVLPISAFLYYAEICL